MTQLGCESWETGSKGVRPPLPTAPPQGRGVMTSVAGSGGTAPLARASAASLVSRRSRRQLAALNKECQFSFSVEDSGDLDPALAYYQLDEGADAVFSSLPVGVVSHVMHMAPPIGHKFLTAVAPPSESGCASTPDHEGSTCKLQLLVPGPERPRSPELCTAGWKHACVFVRGGAGGRQHCGGPR